MQKYAFTMQLNPGMAAEYQKRHDQIWPELITVLKQAGIKDYSIHFEPETHRLFAVLWRQDDHKMADLPTDPIVKKWWDFMADIMEVAPDNQPKTSELVTVFHME